MPDEAESQSGLNSIESTWNKFFGLWSAVWFYSEAPPLITVNFTQGSAVSGTVIQGYGFDSTFAGILVLILILMIALNLNFRAEKNSVTSEREMPYVSCS